MPSARQRRRDALAMVEEAGIEVIGTDMARSSHMKIRCRYKGEEFFKNVGLCEQGADSAFFKKFKGDLKNIKLAIDTDNPVLRAKYLGRPREGRT